MPTAPQEKPVTFEALSSTKLLIGLVVGCVVMYWAFNDRIATRVEKEVTIRVSMETKLARIEERMYACEVAQKATDADNRSQSERINNLYQQVGKNTHQPAVQAPAPVAAP